MKSAAIECEMFVSRLNSLRVSCGFVWDIGKDMETNKVGKVSGADTVF